MEGLGQGYSLYGPGENALGAMIGAAAGAYSASTNHGVSKYDFTNLKTRVIDLELETKALKEKISEYEITLVQLNFKLDEMSKAFWGLPYVGKDFIDAMGHFNNNKN